MFVSYVQWRFAPGVRERVEGAIRDQIVPAARNVAGLRHMYAAKTGEDAWFSVLVYDSQVHAEQGLPALTAVIRGALGDSILSMERQAGDAIIDESFG